LTSTPKALVALAAILLGTAAQAAPASPSPLSPADKVLVDQAAAYLQGLAEVKGRFEQTDARGGISHGDLFLNRPGRARFAYDAPSSLLVVADGRTVWVTDPRLKTINHYPLSWTPLSLFLARQVRFDKAVVVTQVAPQADGYAITAVDPRHRTRGQITLTFAATPLRLTEWSMVDGQGRATQVRLSGLESVSGLDPHLFAGPMADVSPAAQP
jgi:outer membrane lipoprotein-sorting protein